jgi:hypothetical protein
MQKMGCQAGSSFLVRLKLTSVIAPKPLTATILHLARPLPAGSRIPMPELSTRIMDVCSRQRATSSTTTGVTIPVAWSIALP